ncbi:hypothetical protein EJ110_NYTH57411 [Nymphaea thermarum]|nr:hypothetical protein EJ110_NYTH57411 [Nymphaea thermarum]
MIPTKSGFGFPIVETIVETRDGVMLQARVYRPREDMANLAIVLVHPYTVLGGVQGLMKGIAVALANRGYKAVTFDMRGAGRSTGRATLTGSSEVNDTVDVCRWVLQNLGSDRILLVGSSAGTLSNVSLPLHLFFSSKLAYECELPASFSFGPHNFLFLDLLGEVILYIKF